MKENNVKFYFVLFEAKWQCLYIEKLKLVDAVIYKDSNYIILGVKILYYNINFKEQHFKVYKKDIDTKDKYINPLFLWKNISLQSEYIRMWLFKEYV